MDIKVESKIFVKQNNEISIHIKVTCPPVTYQEEQEEYVDARPPMDIIAVVDRSGSMAGDRIRLVKDTIDFFALKLKTSRSIFSCYLF